MDAERAITNLIFAYAERIDAGDYEGVADLWSRVLEHREKLTASGEFERRRREQQVKWMWAMLDDRLFMRLKSDPALRARLPALEAAVAEGRLSPALAVDEIAQAMGL